MATKIVVVDGCDELLDVVHRLGQERKFEVTCCAFGAEALKCIKKVQPDVVVIDLSKTEILGLDLISILKTDPILSVTPIVLCTAPTPQFQRLLDQLAKMRLYVLQAPCEVDAFLAKIKEALGGES